MLHRALVLLGLLGCHEIFELQPIDLHPAGDAMSDVRLDGEPVGCGPRYNVRIRSTASLYARVFDSAHWDAAQAMCAADSMPPGSKTHLVVLSSEAEYADLRPLLTDNNWIGASDRVTEGMFEWITSETTGAYVVSGSGAPWAIGAPTGAGDCLWLDALGALHDMACDKNAAYICECDDRAEDPMNF